MESVAVFRQRAVRAIGGDGYYELPVGDEWIGSYGLLGAAVGQRTPNGRGPADGRQAADSRQRADLRLITNGASPFDWTFSGTPVPAHRPLLLVRRANGAAIHACVPLGGAVRIQYRDVDYLLEPGRFSLFLSTDPMAATHPPQCRVLSLTMPANRIAVADVAARLGRPLAVSGVSELLIRHVQATMRIAHTLDAAGLATAASAAAELFAGTVDRTSGDRTSGPRRQPPPAALAGQVEIYIDSRLGDPALSVEQIAAAHHISVRTLYRLFERRGETVYGYLRGRRLDRCHHDLRTRPELKVSSVCAKWGITDVSHFARQYRERFGATPMETRGKASEVRGRAGVAGHQGGVPVG